MNKSCRQNFAKRFGPQRLIVVGNASARVVTAHHSPTLGIGLRLKLKRLGFKVAIVDEFRTPKSCPNCHSELHISTIRIDRFAISGGRNSISNDRGAKSQNKDEFIKSAEGRWSLHTFLSRPSPRPWLRQRTRVHGLLRFTSRRCCDGLNGRSRYYIEASSRCPILATFGTDTSTTTEDGNTYVDKTQGRRTMMEDLGKMTPQFKRTEITSAFVDPHAPYLSDGVRCIKQMRQLRQRSRRRRERKQFRDPVQRVNSCKFCTNKGKIYTAARSLLLC